MLPLELLKQRCFAFFFNKFGIKRKKNLEKKQRNHSTPKSLTQRNRCNDLRERLSSFEREISKLDAISMLQFVSLCKLFEIVKNQKQQITLRLLFFLVHFFSTAKQSNNKYYYGLTRCKIKEIPLILLIESINLTRNLEKYRKKKIWFEQFEKMNESLGLRWVPEWSSCA